MERIAINISFASARRDKLNDRDVIVAPLTLIVPGVLNGSQGPLFYPPAEIARNVEDWNGMPLVLEHPVENGRPISARSPEVLNDRGLGVVLNTEVEEGKLKAEGWFYVDRLQKIAPQILNAINAGQPVELSTGLSVQMDKANGEFNGVTYNAVAKDYKPDHVAILVHEKGACSINDGCGVLVNEDGEKTLFEKFKSWLKRDGVINDEGDSDMAKKDELVSSIIANCDCWSEDDREVLNGMSEEKLKKLAAHLDQHKKLEAVANAAKKGIETEEYKVVFNEEESRLDVTMKNKKGGKGKKKAMNDGDETEGDEEKVTNKEEKPKTAEEWLSNAPSEIQSAVQNAMRIEKREKETIVNRLTERLDDSDSKTKLKERLMNKSLDELQELALLAPEPKKQEESVANYFGATGTTQVSNDSSDEDELLDIPVLNYSQED